MLSESKYVYSMYGIQSRTCPDPIQNILNTHWLYLLINNSTFMFNETIWIIMKILNSFRALLSLKALYKASSSLKG